MEKTYASFLDEKERKARVRLTEAKNKSKQYYDVKFNNKTFKVDDVVLLLNETKDDKFSNEYNGPFRVIEVINEESNLILDAGKSKPTKVH